jgi:hypothetical protein
VEATGDSTGAMGGKEALSCPRPPETSPASSLGAVEGIEQVALSALPTPPKVAHRIRTSRW